MIYNELAKKQLWDRRISMACVSYFVMGVLNSTIKIVLPEYPITQYMSLIAGCVIIFSLIYSIKIVIKRSSNILYGSYFIFLYLYLLSFILILSRGEPIGYMIRGSAFLTLCWWIPVGVYATSVFDKSILYSFFLKASYSILILLAIMFLLHPNNIYGETGYNMFFGNNLVIPLLFHLNELIKSKHHKYFILVILELFMMLAYANRGCWIPVLFFLFYTYLINHRLSRAKAFAVFLVLIVLFVLCFNVVIDSLFSLMELLGINSRSIEMLMNGAFISDSSNRDIIWNDSMAMIAERPFLGWGLGGEFYHLAMLEGGGVIDSSFHPHNGIIQLFVNFGLLGGIIALLIIIKPFFTIHKIRNTYNRDLCIIWGASFTACFYSASGFFILPNVAIFLYLYYFNRNSIDYYSQS